MTRLATPRCTTLDPRRRIQGTRGASVSSPMPARLAPCSRDARLLEADVAQRNDRRGYPLGEVPGQIPRLNGEAVRGRRQLSAFRRPTDPLQHATRPLRAADDAQPAVDEKQAVHRLVRPVADADDVAAPVSVRGEGEGLDGNHVDVGRGHVDADGIRQHDRPVGSAQLHLGPVATLRHEPSLLVAAVPEELMGTAGSPLSSHDRPHLAPLVVEQRELQPVGTPQPKGDARAPLRTAAHGREDLVHRRPGDRRLLHLQPLGDSERHRRADQQRKGDEERGVAPHGARILIRNGRPTVTATLPRSLRPRQAGARARW